MKVCIVGGTHLAFCTIVAAVKRGIDVVPPEEGKTADLLIIAEDTPTDEHGNRNTDRIYDLCMQWREFTKPIVLMSQVWPGFCRHMGMDNLYHQSETLRVKDGLERAYSPERFIVGCLQPYQSIPYYYDAYLRVFEAPVYRMSWESAEFAKIAINMALAAQVDYTNRLSKAAEKCGASWDEVCHALTTDKRIGPHAYLTPGRWQDSVHLLRDAVTLKEIEDDSL